MKYYKGDYLQEIVFPLWGIGTGGIGISGTGQLVDWELDGRSNKESVNGYSHFAIKAERNGKVIDARVLHGDKTVGLKGTELASHHHSWGYGHGINRTSLAGIAHFPDVSFGGNFPFAEMDFRCDSMPADIHLSAVNPFFPGDEDNSSLPGTFFTFDLTNTSDAETTYTIALSVGNPFKISEGGRCAFELMGGHPTLTLKSNKLEKSDLKYGELLISTDCDDYSYQEYWYRSGWFDDLTTFWREFSESGKLTNRHYDDDDRRGQLDIGDMATLSASVTLRPAETKKVRFVMSWYFPFFENYDEDGIWKHEYVSRFSSAAEVADYLYNNREMLLGKSRAFADAVQNMTAPDVVIEAATDNLCVLKSSTCLRLENGEFWAFEGSNAYRGSCDGTCDHVWLYQYALPLLFPHFARQILEIDYRYNLRESGEMMFRTMLPLGEGHWDFRACVDGQMGCIIRTFREWKLSGDTDWLRRMWPKVKKSLEYAWSPENRDRWDPDRTGVITGRQHHTLDVELFGPNAWLTGFYLTALKAGAEMARAMGEISCAEEYLNMFENGSRFVENELFNGRHYIQKIDLTDKSVLDPYKDKDPDVINYWNDEKDELKYQFAGGCEIDQNLSQWHATINGLGDIFNPVHRRIAAKSIYEINFKSMRDVFNPCRIFAVNDESGVVICEWDKNEYKPKIPIPYTEECMTGFEYALAGYMLQEGLIDEGLEIIGAIRGRYDGKKRNPFAEIECGSSYARSMASFALIPVISGMSFDMTRGFIGLDPIINREEFCSPWFVADGWGTVKITKKKTVLSVLDGKVSLKELKLPDAEHINKITVDGNPVQFDCVDNCIHFNSPLQNFTELVAEL